MKKELKTYDTILGLTEYDEWSYCENDGMWYEDAKEVLPQPLKQSEIISDLTCEIKVGFSAFLGDDDWDSLLESEGLLENFARYVIGENSYEDCTENGILLKTPQQILITGIYDYAFYGLESFIKKLKVQSYATEYLDDAGAIKFIAWTNDNNQTRFVIHSYNDDYEYLKTIFDITIDRNILAAKLESILNTWVETVRNAIKTQEQILNKKAQNPNLSFIINHFFPEFKTPVNGVIKTNLKYLERNNNIRILFAIENGSRAWHMESENSDYDVRFVYKRQAKDYISLNKHKDVIEESLDDEYRTCTQGTPLIDMVGFDIRKYMELLSKSNPTAIEWLMLDIIYYGSNDLPIKQYVINNFNPKTLIYCYISLCKKQYMRMTVDCTVTYKQYLYMMRGLLNALYVYKKGKIPPLDFTKTLEILKRDIPSEIYEKVKEIIELKRQGKEKDAVKRIEILDNFIEQNIVKTFEVPDRKLDLNILNEYMTDEITSKDNIISKTFQRNKQYFKQKNNRNNNFGAGFWIMAVLLLLVILLTFMGY